MQYLQCIFQTQPVKQEFQCLKVLSPELGVTAVSCIYSALQTKACYYILICMSTLYGFRIWWNQNQHNLHRDANGIWARKVNRYWTDDSVRLPSKTQNKNKTKKLDEVNWYISVEKEQRQHKNASTEFMSRMCSIDQLSQTRMEQAYTANGPEVEKNKSISVVKAKNIMSFRNYIKYR